nr:urease isoform X1 [Tanacetum cinerariifolium]
MEKLMLHNACFLGQKRLARGSRLSYTEAVALIATQVGGPFLLISRTGSSLSTLGRGKDVYVSTSPCIVEDVLGPITRGRRGKRLSSTLHNDMSNTWLSFDFSHGIIVDGSPLAYKITREAYANIYGPTVGDKIRLGDTNLFAEVEKDFVVYGDECVFDKGIKGGCISAIKKAGNPDAMYGVFSNMIIGVSTEVIAGEGKIVTAGVIDCHVHFICSQLAYEAIASGAVGAMGLKFHEDWGTTHAAIDNCLTVAEQYDIQMVSHQLGKNIPEDVSFAKSPIQAKTIAVKDILHDTGAITIISPDSQAMCWSQTYGSKIHDIPKVICGTWQIAHKMKLQRGPIDGNIPDNDNLCIKCFIAKYTINLAIANGISDHLGSVE